MIKACLFDLDGTLLDTLDSIKYYLNAALARHGVPEVSREQTRIFVGGGAKNLVFLAAHAGGVDTSTEEGEKLISLIHREYVLDYDSDAAYLTEAYEGIPKAIAALRALGVKLAVISNKPDSTVGMLVEKIFGDTFDIVEGAKEGVPLKPNPESSLSICERLGVLPSETLYFGDTATDMITAKRYGAYRACGVLWGFRDRDELVENGADELLSHPSQIPSLIEKYS